MQTNVQPAGSSLPPQTGNSGKFLTTNGTDASWAAVDAIQVSAMPVAAVGYLDKIVQYVGATDASYTNGYFYKCVSDGGNPATYSWSQLNVQPAGSSLPSQTGNSGKFLTTNGTDASWATVNALQNTATGTNSLTLLGTPSTGDYNINVGGNNSISGQYSIAIGEYAAIKNSSGGAVAVGVYAEARAWYGTAIGQSALATAGNSTGVGANAYATAIYAIQLGYGTNNVANTFSVGLSQNANYRLLDSNGTIPTDRYTTTPSADGTYVPTLTISSGVATRTWGAAASAPVVPSTMPTLAVADWSSNTQTVNVTGVTASNIVFVSPAPASAADYAAAGIVCTAQGSGTLTFTCTTVPSNAITVNVVILG